MFGGYFGKGSMFEFLLLVLKAWDFLKLKYRR